MTKPGKVAIHHYSITIQSPYKMASASGYNSPSIDHSTARSPAESDGIFQSLFSESSLGTLESCRPGVVEGQQSQDRGRLRQRQTQLQQIHTGLGVVPLPTTYRRERMFFFPVHHSTHPCGKGQLMLYFHLAGRRGSPLTSKLSLFHCSYLLCSVSLRRHCLQ